MTIREIEAACDAGLELDFSRHEIEAPPLSFSEVFYPLGFPTSMSTNSEQIHSLFKSSWGDYKQRFVRDLIRVDVHQLYSKSITCPPLPTYRIMWPFLHSVADKDNYSVTDLERGQTKITVSTAALEHPKYLRYFFLDASAAVHIATRYTTPIHAGCVGLDGRGVLLCGDSGAGKSSLSYACARAGLTYTSDDCSFLMNGGTDRTVIGESHRVRLRPSAAALFPEIEDLKMTPRAAGKPSIEILTASMPNITSACSARADYIVFLNRSSGTKAGIRPYRKDVARHAMRQILYGSPASLSIQYETIERLLEADVFELRYTEMNWAVDRITQLLREGV